MDILQIIKYIIENSSPITIFIGFLLITAWVYSFGIKQYSGLHAINSKNKEILFNCINENFSNHKSLYIEEAFNSYYKNGITHKEIEYILKNSSSSRLNLIQYKKSVSYVNFKENSGYSLKTKNPKLFYFAKKYLIIIFILSLIISSISLLSSILIVFLKNNWQSGISPLILFIESALLAYSTLNINIGMAGAISLVNIENKS